MLPGVLSGLPLRAELQMNLKRVANKAHILESSGPGSSGRKSRNKRLIGSIICRFEKVQGQGCSVGVDIGLGPAVYFLY